MPPNSKATTEETAVSPQQLREQLVDQLIRDKHIKSEAVKSAFLAVPRHHFVPSTPLDQVYRDQVIPTKFDGNEAISSSSQPAMMAIMLEQLGLEAGQKVLEIGAGTGFNAALMAHIVGETGHVTTIDIDEDLVDDAISHLAMAGIENVTALCGDGTLGYAPNGRYDRIILTVGGWDIAPAWWEQLAENGRLLLPLSLNGPQLSVAFKRVGNHLESSSIYPCGFMRLRGDHAEPATTTKLSEDAALIIPNQQSVPETTAVHAWLGQSATQETDLTVNNREMWSAFPLWLALHTSNTCSLYAWATAVRENRYPALFKYNGEHPRQRTYGLFDADGMALLERPNEPDNASEQTYSICIHTLGKTAVGKALLAHLQAWHTARRPAVDRLRLTAYPTHNAVAQSEPSGNIVLRKRWSTFVCQWQAARG